VTTGAAGLMQRSRRFPRARRLKRQRLIRPLFETDRPDVGSQRVGPLTARYRIVSPEEVGSRVPLQVGFAVGRRIGDRPERNRIKRLLREVYRMHQHPLVDLFSSRPDTLTMMVLYRGRFDGASTSIPRSLPKLLDGVADACREAPSGGRMNSRRPGTGPDALCFGAS